MPVPGTWSTSTSPTVPENAPADPLTFDLPAPPILALRGGNQGPLRGANGRPQGGSHPCSPWGGCSLEPPESPPSCLQSPLLPRLSPLSHRPAGSRATPLGTALPPALAPLRSRPPACWPPTGSSAPPRGKGMIGNGNHSSASHLFGAARSRFPQVNKLPSPRTPLPTSPPGARDLDSLPSRPSRLKGSPADPLGVRSPATPPNPRGRLLPPRGPPAAQFSSYLLAIRWAACWSPQKSLVVASL